MDLLSFAACLSLNLSWTEQTSQQTADQVHRRSRGRPVVLLMFLQALMAVWLRFRPLLADREACS